MQCVLQFYLFLFLLFFLIFVMYPHGVCWILNPCCCVVQEEDEELKAQILNSYRLTSKKEHTRILQRRAVIEERKEQLENLNDARVSAGAPFTFLFFFSNIFVMR